MSEVRSFVRQSVFPINEWLEAQGFRVQIHPKHLHPLKDTCLLYGQKHTLRHYKLEIKGNTLVISAEVWNDRLLPVSPEPGRPKRRIPRPYLTKSLIIQVTGDLIDRRVIVVEAANGEDKQTLYCRKPILKRDCSPADLIIW